MISFKSFVEGWDRFFFSKTDASMLSIFRILMGVFLFINGISLVEDFHYWFGVGTDALVPLADSNTFYRGFRINLFRMMSPTESSAWLILWGYIVTSIFVMVGFKTRLSTIVCFVLLVSLQARNHAILNSGDTLTRCLLFLLMFAPTHVKYSVDAWLMKKKGAPYSPEVSILTIRLIQLQFSLVYLATTLFKCKGYDWIDGTAVYYTARLLNFQRFAIPFAFDYVFLVKFFTWTALFIEFAMGSLVWVREFRVWVLISGILLHLGIEITMSIGFFEWLMIAAYLLFVEPHEFKAMLNWVKGKLPLRPKLAS